MEHNSSKTRVTLTLPNNLIDVIDQYAARDFQTRVQWIHQGIIRLVREEQIKEENLEDISG